MKQKRLLQINVTANWGSTGKIAEDIGKIAISKGWESYIAYGRYMVESASHLIRIGKPWDILLHGMVSRLFDKHGLYSKNATLNFIKQIDVIKPDIIHIHNIHGYYINYEILFKFLAEANIPVVWTLHDCWAITGHCSYFDAVGCEKWKKECNNCPQINSYPTSMFLDNSRKNYRLKKELFNNITKLTLVPVSNWLNGIISESFLAKKNIRTIHNGIDIEKFKPKYNDTIYQKLNIANRKIVLGVASVWEARKGLNDFISLRSILPNNFSIILIGINKKQLRSLPDGIIGIERTNNIDELIEYYSTSDVFVNPTWEDTFPTTNIEALACGTPVITYRTGGSPEIIDETTGLVVEKGDIEALSKSIIQICNKTNKDDIRIKCRKRAEALYNKDETFKKYVELYESIIH